MLSPVSKIKAQTSSEIEAVMAFLGVDSPEELDAYEVERLSSYIERPVRLNLASVSKLTSCGLLSGYQVASFADYRARHGDVMSFAELSAVDGFGEEFTRLLAPFVSLYSGNRPAGSFVEELQYDSDLAVRGGLKLSDIGADEALMQWGYGIKYRVEGGGLTAGMAISDSDISESAESRTGSGYLGWQFRQIPLSLLIGDFNLRFGQGLALWNGMSMNSTGSPSSFMRNPSGISRSWSFTGSGALTGIASEAAFGRISLSSAIVLPGIKQSDGSMHDVNLMPVANVAWNGRKGQISFTHYAEFSGVFDSIDTRIPDMKSSVDISWCVCGTDLFSELAYDWVNASVAGLAGTRFKAGEAVHLAVMLRNYPSGYAPGRSGAARSGTKCTNESGVSFSGLFAVGDWVRLSGHEGFGASVRRHSGTFSLDAAHFPVPKGDNEDGSQQLKAICCWDYAVSGHFRLKIRASERIRSWGRPFRTDIRTDLLCAYSKFSAAMRINALKCDGIGLLGYIEGGYSGEQVKLFLRQGVFIIDDWDDRIYAYERDAPGSFNIPAFYGRGLWTSLYASWRFSRWGRLYLRAAFTGYPFMREKKKPGKAELKLQCVFSF